MSSRALWQVLLLASLACVRPALAQPAHDHAAHQADVAARGTEVMPFSLAATQHVFTKTAQGGVQKVVARDSADTAQIHLVRAHLKDIRAQFSKGDFSAPAHIHGHDMPGLAALSAAPPGAIAITYRDVPGGAELVYVSRDRALVAAIHQWFDAQLSDHGKDAVAGHHH